MSRCEFDLWGGANRERLIIRTAKQHVREKAAARAPRGRGATSRAGGSRRGRGRGRGADVGVAVDVDAVRIVEGANDDENIDEQAVCDDEVPDYVETPTANGDDGIVDAEAFEALDYDLESSEDAARLLQAGAIIPDDFATPEGVDFGIFEEVADIAHGAGASSSSHGPAPVDLHLAEPPVPSPIAAPSDGEAALPAVIIVVTPYGSIKYYSKSKNMVAEAKRSVFGKRTHFTRTTRESNLKSSAGQGRCVGLMMAWLMFMDPTKGRSTIIHMWTPSLKERTEARAAFALIGTDAVRMILERGERKQRPGEPMEPVGIM